MAGEDEGREGEGSTNGASKAWHVRDVVSGGKSALLAVCVGVEGRELKGEWGLD